uniref:Uncharacterized protein n=1 Tax=Siphoviridae sp. ctZd434 TaxID=2825559 RepID=A0A8S5UHD3_9CAUD|nr:MAG TPA: hypothetical protein [Siphoviridae sp. ctZd434]
MNMCVFPYLVHVNAYDRVRLRRVEHVCEHWRSYPLR